MARLTALAAAIGAVIAALAGDTMGTAVQATLVAVAGLVAAVAVHEHHANARKITDASVQIGAHQTIADAVAGAVHHALGLALGQLVAATQPAPDPVDGQRIPVAPTGSFPSSPPGSTVTPGS